MSFPTFGHSRQRGYFARPDRSEVTLRITQFKPAYTRATTFTYENGNTAVWPRSPYTIEVRGEPEP